MRWLNQERLKVYPRIFLALYLLFGLALIVSALASGPHLLDFLGRPLGADFSHYWVASSLVLHGDPLAVYQVSRFLAAQAHYFTSQYQLPWLYPPTFLLAIAPLAALPYLASLAVWLGVTLSGFLAVLRRIAPIPLTIWLALAFPGTFQNFFQGQNGFLSASLLGGGLLLLDQQPLLGGLILGLLSYKPHLMALVPLALIAGRRWRALFASLTTALALGLASLLILGPGVWLAFGRNLSLPFSFLKNGNLPVEKMVTVFSAAFQWGLGVSAALTIHALVALAVALGVFWVWRRPTPLAERAAILVLGCLLFPPYAFSYDLALMALPLAWLGWEGYTKGWLPGEQILLTLGWLAPLITTVVAMINLPFAALVLLALFIAVLRRSLKVQVFEES